MRFDSPDDTDVTFSSRLARPERDGDELPARGSDQTPPARQLDGLREHSPGDVGWTGCRRSERRARVLDPPLDGHSERRNVEQPPRPTAQPAGCRERPLLENSTACRKSVPSTSSSPFFVGFFGLMDESVSSWSVRSGCQASTESLILAQDERWRRA